MKNINIAALASMLALAACQGAVETFEEKIQEGVKVTIGIPVRVQDTGVQTKAFGEVPSFETAGLYVAVYEGGYRCEVAKAELSGAPVVDVNGSFVYNYDLTLTSSANPRNLHFISMEGFTPSMAPFEENRIGSEMYSENGVDAYWQRVKLGKVSDVAAMLKSDLGTVTMIRNFAKITLIKDDTKVPDSKFSLDSYKVFNTPDRGHIAPYIVSGTSIGYVDNYHNLTYTEAYEQYPGKVPAGATMNGYTSADDGGASFISASEPFYMYERPIPTDATAAFIIVKGYYEGSTTPCYYKINLQDDDGKYYALLRGFRFKINIDGVTGEGCNTVKAAIESAGSGDISTSLSYIDVNNISDGNCRLFVSETSFTVIKESDIVLKYKFCPTATDLNTVANGQIGVDVANNADGITVSISEPEYAGENSISKTAGKYDVTVHGTASDRDSDGYNYITIHTTSHENIYKEQVVSIRGRGTNSNTGDVTEIQRDVHIIVRPTLRLSAECLSTNNKSSLNGVKISLGVEPELPKSIFPLQFRIEAESLTLTPDNSYDDNNMPVENGISARTGKPTFYFVKTISYEEYTEVTALSTVGGVSDMKKFDCYFKENVADGSTSLNVSADLFNLVTFGY